MQEGHWKKFAGIESLRQSTKSMVEIERIVCGKAVELEELNVEALLD